MRIEIHVRPGAATTHVGGVHDGALVVRVTEPPDQGRATTAALAALADALALPRGSVTLVRGATSRRKLVEVAPRANQQATRARLDRLRSEP